MKILTYNVLKGGDDADDASRWSDVRAVLEDARPDVLALQECNGFEQDGARRLHTLEAALGMHGALVTAESGFHVALFTRGGAAREVQRLHRGFAHVALAARVDLAGRRATIVVAHLSPFSGAQRLAEAERIIAWCEGARRAGEDVLVLGDLNALSPHDVAALRPGDWPERYQTRHLLPDGTIDTRAIACLERSGLVDLQHACATRRGHPAAPTRPTAAFAEGRPAQRLDYIFASDALAARVEDCRPADAPGVERASDHRPLWATFED